MTEFFFGMVCGALVVTAIWFAAIDTQARRDCKAKGGSYVQSQCLAVKVLK